ncbi:MAG: hypothetical protein JWP03_1459 [Phycisphaerales bacterium]|nr:hypothetical protein [Phycisphaerales bacterium]
MPSSDPQQYFHRSPSARGQGAAPALRRASHKAAGQLIELLEARQLLSAAHTPTPQSSAPLHSVSFAHVAPAAPATVVTNQSDYLPGQIATITGTGFGAGEKVRLQVLHIDGTPNTASEHRPWTVRAGTDGTFTTSYLVGKDDLNTTLRLTAVGLSTHRRATEIFTDGSATTTTVTSSTGSAPGPLVKPSHIVVVVEEDRYANAIGDTTNMPYINSLASTGLAYTNSHGLNTTSQEGQMSYLGLYSGSTQGVTDNGNHGVFTGPNLAQSLNNNGLSFTGYAESLPSNGDTTHNLAADPTNAAYDDLYVRAYNPMAQFSNVGTGLTNANVNKTFANFPTTVAGYASLPTVSFVIPNTRGNTHGSNDTNPFATDPSAYNGLRKSADTWLQQKMDGYLQWAKANNSLLIITSDEGDRAHTFANGFATIINGSSSLFTPGVDTTNVTPYNILRTIEDMYALPQLGSSASASELDTNAQGKLGAPSASSGGGSGFGQPVTFTATVAPVATGSGTPTGTVQFKIDGSNFGSPVTLVNGSAASASISSMTVASHTITAVYSSDATYAASTSPTLTQVVSQASTTTAISSSDTSAVWGQSVTLTATVAPVAPSTGVPTGTVNFMDGTTQLGASTLNASGQATFNTSSLTVASHSITAVYVGSTGYNTSTSSSLGETVSRDAATAGVTSSANPSVFGQSVTLTATLAAAAPGSGTPTGTVTFMDGTATLGTGTLSAAGQATFVTSALGVSSHSITAVYAGDAHFAGVTSSALSQVVNLASTTTTITPPAATVTGQSVSFTATVAPVAPGAGTPAGTVQFVIDGANSGSPITLSGGSATSASIVLSTAGQHSVSAVYSGSSSFAGSTATSVTQTVNKASTSAALASSLNPATAGQSVTFTATLSAIAPGAGTPTGTVTFFDGTTAVGSGTLSASGKATWTTSTLSAASHSISASYAADSNFAGSTSATLNETINPATTTASTTTGVVSSANPTVFGQGVSFTATVSPVSPATGTPTGTVQFTIDGANFGSPVTLVNGSATSSSLTTLSVSGHNVAAVYSSDANFAASTSPTLVQTVNQASTSAAVSSSASSAVWGQSVTFTATISATAPGTGTPTGTVTFMDGATSLGSGTLSAAGQATFTTSSLALSSHSITAVYNGDTNFITSTSPALTQTISTASTAVALATSANPSTSGQLVTFTATVSATAPSAGTPTGTVTFMDGATTLGTGTLNASRQATFTTTTLSVASHSITAVYAGDTTFTGSTSAAVTQTVNAAVSNGPASNTFATAGLLTGTSITATGSNVGATKETGEPNHGGNAGGHSVWWSWTAPTSATVTIDTLGSSFDTLLGVYTGSAVSALTTVASNDDSPAGGTATSKVTFAAVSGTTYRIAVDGYGGAVGSITLHLSVAATVTTNDNFANRTTLTGTSITTTGSNSGATKETGEPNHGGNAGGHSVWWSWTAPTSGTVTIDTLGSSFDTLLGVYTGTSVSALTTVASNDDRPACGTATSKVTFAVTAGTTYQIAVDGYGGVTGSITLHLTLA